MSYNPNVHKRKSIRLKDYNYSHAGLYFITICCEHQKNRFGKIRNEEMILNDFGNIAYNQWLKLAERFVHFELDVFQIMPNHMHAIIKINNYLETDNISEQFDIQQLIIEPLSNLPPEINTDKIKKTIGNIIGAYKSLVYKECLNIVKSRKGTLGKLWHRNYFEHIIRDEKSYDQISDYIINNPSKWQADRFFTI